MYKKIQGKENATKIKKKQERLGQEDRKRQGKFHLKINRFSSQN